VEAARLLRHAVAWRVPLLTTNLVLTEVHRLTLVRAGVQPALRGLDLVDASPSPPRRPKGRTRLSPHPVTSAEGVGGPVGETARCRHVLGFGQDLARAGFTPRPD
jgi:hypothetical protein